MRVGALTTLSLLCSLGAVPSTADDAHAAFQADIVFNNVFHGQLPGGEFPKLTVGTPIGSIRGVRTELTLPCFNSFTLD